MEISLEQVGDVMVALAHTTYLDASNAEEFKHDLGPMLDENDRVLLDLGEIQFMDSTGLGAILACLRRTGARNGTIKLFGVLPTVRPVFQMSRMSRIVDILETREDGLESFGAGHP